METKGLFEYEIIINALVSFSASFEYVMLWVYGNTIFF